MKPFAFRRIALSATLILSSFGFLQACADAIDAPDDPLTNGDELTAGSPNGIYEAAPRLIAGGLPPGVVYPAAPMAQPAPGARGIDPTFGTKIRRLLPTGVHEYSQLQVISDDGVYALLRTSSGYAIYRYADMALIRQIPNAAAPRWLPGTHKIFYLVGLPARIMMVDADSGALTTHMTFSAYQYADTAPAYGRPSDDGRWTAVWLHNGDARTLIAVDLRNKTLGASIHPHNLFAAGVCTPDPQWGEVGPDWMNVSPRGDLLVIQWKKDGGQRCSGLETFNIRTGAFIRQIHQHHNHSDMGVSADGRQFIMTVGTSPLNHNYPDIVAEWLDGAAPKHIRMTPWGTFGHVSCRGPRGVCVVSAETSPGTSPLLGEIFAIYLDGSVRHLAHHRSTACDYWSQPKGSLSADGKRVTITSDWGTCNANAPYVIELPTSLAPAGVGDAGVGDADAGDADAGDGGPPDSSWIFLQSTLSSLAAVRNPAVGLGGQTNLTAFSFVPAHSGAGAQFRIPGAYMKFPLSTLARATLLSRGEVEFWYQPNYAAGVNDTTHVLIVIGDYYNAPRVQLTHSDRLSISVVGPDWISHTASAPYHARLWAAGESVHIIANWDNSRTTDALKLSVNGQWYGSGSVSPDFTGIVANGLLFVGSANTAGDFSASGVIDGLIVRAAPSR